MDWVSREHITRKQCFTQSVEMKLVKFPFNHFWDWWFPIPMRKTSMFDVRTSQTMLHEDHAEVRNLALELSGIWSMRCTMVMKWPSVPLSSQEMDMVLSDRLSSQSSQEISIPMTTPYQKAPSFPKIKRPFYPFPGLGGPEVFQIRCLMGVPTMSAKNEAQTIRSEFYV